jgi:hypothetical protein
MQSAFRRISLGNGQDSSHCRQRRGAGPRHLPWRQNPSGGAGFRGGEGTRERSAKGPSANKGETELEMPEPKSLGLDRVAAYHTDPIKKPRPTNSWSESR